jgi:hypothetical protein
LANVSRSSGPSETADQKMARTLVSSELSR